MIQVINEQGEYLHETYEKRAKGLVKKGRARYVNEQTICLCLPAMEETEMEFTKEDILTRIDEILHDTTHLKEANMLLERLPNDLDVEVLAVRTKAINDIVHEREETNRQMVTLLQSMIVEKE